MKRDQSGLTGMEITGDFGQFVDIIKTVIAFTRQGSVVQIPVPPTSNFNWLGVMLLHDLSFFSNLT